mmetsp:Transcript_13614/g.15494  ORF Transcript_13614/g.15494 Transcript_13614/m.15494 type:complete len:199 (+) Transcript_13614:254-850(+)|eukprot:CAMPEP_0184045478 /NCGR_PEP_ID=MMETSP0956-20121227/925_1 /TAXON_ID=627963 /ORGANISM="Aplanochytrium sp, Strain PBS07" /LENGTH=198 /DNA_ID=CAMNT_0026336759 /DNA_START=188 /DNA_END=784 /DNA_ORIENTATION=+
MKIIGISILSAQQSEPVFLAQATDLSQFGFFERSTAAQFVKFISRTVMKRTPKGKRQSVIHEGNTVRAHLRTDGLGAVMVSDQEYPERVSFSILNKLLEDFATQQNGKWQAVVQDTKLEFPPLDAAIKEYQDPTKADKITKIQKDLDDTIGVMHKTIENLLERDVKLNSLVEKSDDLSAQSKLFYKSAAEHNACCTIS